MKKAVVAIAAAVLTIGALTGCTNNEKETQNSPSTGAAESSAATEESTVAGEVKKIIVGATPAPHAEILSVSKEVLAKDGYELVVMEYTDYVQPNLALDSGDLDANFFQHLPYLEQFNEENKTDLVAAASIHYEPFGIYAGKTDSLEDLKDGAKIAVPNDVSNEARALLLLEANGLITLKEDAGLTATKNDIVENPKNIEIIELEAAQIPRSLDDADVAVINGNYAIEAGLNISDALAVEDAESIAAITYANIVAVKAGEESSEEVNALINALTSEEVKTFIEEKYQGAVVPLF